MTFIDSLQSAFVWYLAISAISLLTYPITYAICRGLPDRGLSLYRPLGMVLATLPLWWIGNLTGLPFTGMTFLAAVILIGTLAWGFAVLRTGLITDLRPLGRRLLIIETSTAALFFGYVLLRGYNPDIWGTEKPMELAFLSASIQADGLPVGDPWFAGEPINYYYYGYAVLALFAKITGLPGGVVFTLGLATTFSLSVVAAGGVAAAIAERITNRPDWAPSAAGLLGGTLLMFAGNLHAAVELARSPSETLSAGWWDGVGWSASRIIEDTGFPDDGTRTVISEFPAFSWILGDLHPHVLAYPWLIVAFALIVNYVYLASTSHRRGTVLVGAASIGLLIGVLYSSNTWDVAIVGLLAAIGILLTLRATGWRVAGLSSVTIGTTAIVTAVPFALHYTAAAGATAEQTGRGVPLVDRLSATVGFVDWDRTTSGELLLAHGGFLILALVVIAGIWRYLDDWDQNTLFLGAIAAGAFSLASLLLSTPALTLIGIPLIAILIPAIRSSDAAGCRLPLLLVAAGLGVIIVLEFLFIRDPFGDRMNTIFKVYFALWALFSIALGALVPIAIGFLAAAFNRVVITITVAVVAVTLLSMSVYTPLSAYRWYSEFDNWTGVDGTAYLEDAQPAESAAIDWLREHAGPSDVVLEAPGCSYGADNRMPHSRVSMATGVSTVIGWDGHQRQWRRQQPDLLPEIGTRIEDVRLIYEQPNSDEAASLREGYGVTYVVVGAHESTGYAQCGLGPPYDPEGLRALGDSDLDLVFEQDEVQIYAPNREQSAN